jgi:hypothetical protein
MAGAGGAGAGITNGMTQSQMLATQNAGISGADALTKAAMTTGGTTAPAAAGMSVGEGLMGAAKIQAGTALIGGVMQGKAAEDQRNAQLEQERLARERYGANVGANLWSGSASEVDTGSGAPRPAAAPAFAYDPYAELQRLRAAREAAAMPTGGIIARNTTGYTPYRT